MIGIRGIAHENRIVVMGIHIYSSYHAAKIKWLTDIALLILPLNHYDKHLLLEGFVGRQPKWTLPNGKLNFISFSKYCHFI